MHRLIVLLTIMSLIMCGGEEDGDYTSQTYYVATNGSDANSGSIEEPFKSIHYGISKLNPGDTLIIMDGTYRERITTIRSGKKGRYITISAYNNNKVIIDGNNITLEDTLTGLVLITNSYIIIRGINVINAGTNLDNAGILVKNAAFVYIEGCFISNTTSSGIGVWNCHDIAVNSNEVVLACNDGCQECISVDGSYNFDVCYNVVHDSGPGSNGGEGIDIKDGTHDGRVFKNIVYNINRVGIYIDAWDKHTYNIDLYQNIVYRCKDGGFALSCEMGGLLEDVNVYNNISYSNEYYGIVITDWEDEVHVSSHPMLDIKIINNTICYNGSTNWGGGICVENATATNIIIRNNICYSNTYFQMALETNNNYITIDHNLMFGNTNYDNHLFGSNYKITSPMFVSATDFHLKSTSPAIDSGSIDNAPNVDFDGNKRPSGNGYDIGCFEYQE